MRRMTQHAGLDPTDLLTPGEVARLLSVHPATVAIWAKTGLLVPVFDRAGVRLYSRRDIDQLALELVTP